MTFLTLVNSVLTRLRESTVALISESEYSTLIGEFVNEAKREVEDSWDWASLRTTKTVAMVAGQSTGYEVAGLGDRFNILSIVDTMNNVYLSQMSPIEMTRRRSLTPTDTGNPVWFCFRGISASGNLLLDVWPEPTAVSTLFIDVKLPDSDLVAEADRIRVPSWPVKLKAHELALRERGEDGGLSWQEIRQNYDRALADAISQDVARSGGETTWRVE